MSRSLWLRAEEGNGAKENICDVSSVFERRKHESSIFFCEGFGNKMHVMPICIFKI